MCWEGKVITFNLLQKYELNMLKLRMYDLNNRTYDFTVYAVSNLGIKLIYDTISSSSTLTIKFPT